jgi:hypothetical protein
MRLLDSPVGPLLVSQALLRVACKSLAVSCGSPGVSCSSHGGLLASHLTALQAVRGLLRFPESLAAIRVTRQKKTFRLDDVLRGGVSLSESMSKYFSQRSEGVSPGDFVLLPGNNP